MNFVGPYSDFPYGLPPIAADQGAVDMDKIVTTAGFPFLVSELMADLRIDTDDEAPTVARMARAAAAFIERRTGLVVLAGRYECKFNAWPSAFAPWRFIRAPLRSIVSIDLFDPTSSPPDWDPQIVSNFYAQAYSREFRVAPAASYQPLPVPNGFGGIRMRFDAGYDVVLESGENPDDQISGDPEFDAGEAVRKIPDDVRWAVTALTAHYYENRELFMADKLTQIESSAGGLLASLRVLW